MRILQVVGYKNNGKTTLINELIRICNDREIVVSTIKHHGHGEEDISLNHKEVDSLSFIKNGANESIVMGKHLIERVTKVDRTLEEIIEGDLSVKPDVLLIEGFKSAKYPKIVLKQNDQPIEETLENIKYTFNAFEEAERAAFLEWFVEWLSKE
ncbi:molybdopterin-guanine dinucleotide biosynthesis protein B [Mammaliicoccus sp. Dog046]|uniref:molybdopterin-guanine dinucleotide biosynthesis protein B n=1 Tax=Mammaliicoccus sp. Dog046 TaxID=3034233 RepID=UPI002B25C781|nr:molybdopterin-guanine dinucleotide biosynthesis protein B [Mammaliicoccus sp. Dog046]WQK85969.1 molybdopterin-guanine dinucleotide biosynthesis protein B [Mammaliicoccus sp. Dog046]